MKNIYIPSDYLNSPCIIQNNGYMRAYTNSQLTDYVDIYYQNNYALRNGYSSYGYNGQCDTINTYTDNPLYRNDFDRICVIFLTFLFCIIILIKPISKKFFKGGF